MTTLALAIIGIALVILTTMHRTLFAFLLTFAVFIALAERLIHPAEPMPAQSRARASVAPAEPARIVVPAPSPSADGELLDRWARANAPLVPLN